MITYGLHASEFGHLQLKTEWKLNRAQSKFDIECPKCAHWNDKSSYVGYWTIQCWGSIMAMAEPQHMLSRFLGLRFWNSAEILRETMRCTFKKMGMAQNYTVSLQKNGWFQIFRKTKTIAFGRSKSTPHLPLFYSLKIRRIRRIVKLRTYRGRLFFLEKSGNNMIFWMVNGVWWLMMVNAATRKPRISTFLKMSRTYECYTTWVCLRIGYTSTMLYPQKNRYVHGENDDNPFDLGAYVWHVWGKTWVR